MEYSKMNTQYSETDPRYHTQHVRGMMQDIITHLREDIRKIKDPKAEALFETTAEVLTGLSTAFEHYEQKAEEAWHT
jgi:hypothetical protein